jgi:protein-S-isoprenylcysteine O-methyltransferase Ste14
MQRKLFFAYGLANYLLFFAVYAWLACFVGNFLLPRTIDSGTSAPFVWALAIDAALVLAFGLQHSIMARPAFKALWTRLVPTPIERSTYMLASSLVLIALMCLWRPLNVVIWNVTSPVGWWIATALFATGWLLVPLVSLAISHFDLFGMRQVWLYLQGRPYTPLPFRTPLPYNVVRHPLYIGWAIAFWATPTMTLGHLLFASLMTVYMLAASRVEERDLVAYFGHKYEDYRRRVPAFIPLPRFEPTPPPVEHLTAE